MHAQHCKHNMNTSPCNTTLLTNCSQFVQIYNYGCSIDDEVHNSPFQLNFSPLLHLTASVSTLPFSPSPPSPSPLTSLSPLIPLTSPSPPHLSITPSPPPHLLTSPSLLKFSPPIPLSCPFCRMDTVSVVVLSHTQMKGFLPI